MSSPNIQAQFDSVFGVSPARRDTVTDRVIAATARTYELEATVARLRTILASNAITRDMVAARLSMALDCLPRDGEVFADRAAGDIKAALEMLTGADHG